MNCQSVEPKVSCFNIVPIQNGVVSEVLFRTVFFHFVHTKKIILWWPLSFDYAEKSYEVGLLLQLRSSLAKFRFSSIRSQQGEKKPSSSPSSSGHHVRNCLLDWLELFGICGLSCVTAG
jgi:hypothetical protein